MMNWYVAKIVLGISVESKNPQQFDEQLRLISAENEEEAFLKARMIGLAEEEGFINDSNKQIRWEFINVAELIELKDLGDGVELYSRIHEIEEPRAYIAFIHQKGASLRLNLETA